MTNAALGVRRDGCSNATRAEDRRQRSRSLLSVINRIHALPCTYTLLSHRPTARLRQSPVYQAASGPGVRRVRSTGAWPWTTTRDRQCRLRPRCAMTRTLLGMRFHVRVTQPRSVAGHSDGRAWRSTSYSLAHADGRLCPSTRPERGRPAHGANRSFTPNPGHRRVDARGTTSAGKPWSRNRSRSRVPMQPDAPIGTFELTVNAVTTTRDHLEIPDQTSVWHVDRSNRVPWRHGTAAAASR